MQDKGNNTPNRIPWINGLKGIACLMVFFHHFFLSFYPGIYYGPNAEAKTASGIDVLMGYKHYGFIINGNFAVSIFVMISAFLFAMKTIRDDREGKKTDLLNVCLQRYLRLMPPVAIASVIYYVTIKILNLTGHNYAGFQSELTVFGLIKHIFFYQWITNDAKLMGPLWCMYVIFIGGFIAVFLSKLSKAERKYMPLIYLVISAGLMFMDTNMLPVGLGVMLADIYCNERLKVDKTAGYICGGLMIILGLFLGGYPSYAAPDNFLYGLIQRLPGNIYLSHGFGAFFLILGIMILPRTIILSSKVLGFLGNISFSVFLLHTIYINLLSYYMTDLLARKMGNYNLGALTCFAITVVLVIASSVLYTEFVEKKIALLTKKIRFK